MANAILTFEIMPVSPDVDLEPVKEKALEIAKKHGAKGNMESSIEPVAFGLKKVIIMGMYDVSDDKDFDEITAEMKEIEGVNSAEIAKMDLAMG
jgi:translation elongation factor aEF-1 beta